MASSHQEEEEQWWKDMIRAGVDLTQLGFHTTMHHIAMARKGKSKSGSESMGWVPPSKEFKSAGVIMESELRLRKWWVTNPGGTLDIDESVLDTLEWRLRHLPREHVEVYDEFYTWSGDGGDSKTKWRQRMERPWDEKKNKKDQPDFASWIMSSSEEDGVLVAKKNLHKEPWILEGHDKEGWGAVWTVNSETQIVKRPQALSRCISARHKHTTRVRLPALGLQVEMSRIRYTWSAQTGLDSDRTRCEVEIEQLPVEAADESSSSWFHHGLVLVCGAFSPVKR